LLNKTKQSRLFPCPPTPFTATFSAGSPCAQGKNGGKIKPTAKRHGAAGATAAVFWHKKTALWRGCGTPF
jgi:hypothetical protein